jgi:hypothetical protein
VALSGCSPSRSNRRKQILVASGGDQDVSTLKPNDPDVAARLAGERALRCLGMRPVGCRFLSQTDAIFSRNRIGSDVVASKFSGGVLGLIIGIFGCHRWTAAFPCASRDAADRWLVMIGP